MLRVTTQYKSLDDVLGIVLGGSVARGFADDSSDVEIYVYAHKRIPSSEEVRTIMKNLNSQMTRSSDMIWNHEVWGPHTFFALEDVKFELGYRIFPEIKERINRYLSGEDILSHHTNESDTPFGHYTSGIASCVLSSAVLYEDKSGDFSDFRSKLQDFPQALQKKLFDHYFNDASIMHKVKLKSSAQRNDDFSFNSQLASIIRSMNIALFALNETHFPGDKWNGFYIEQFKVKPIIYEPTLRIILEESNAGPRNKCYKYVCLERLLKEINNLARQRKNGD